MEIIIKIALVFGIFASVFGLILLVLVRHLRTSYSSGRQNGNRNGLTEETSSQRPSESKVPSAYTVRGNLRHIALQRLIPRLIMWGVIASTVLIALYLYNPNMIIDTIRRFGPSVGTSLLGFAVLGIGQSMEEKHRSYEFSQLGWGGAMILWIIALVILFK